MITGTNHITLAATDLLRSVVFYRDLLGFHLRADWPRGAYLSSGDLWLCITLAKAVAPRGDDSHIAFSVPRTAFPALVERLHNHVEIWQDNVSEGPSIYFLDPDGHKLELHVGGIEDRLAHYRAHPDKGVRVYG